MTLQQQFRYHAMVVSVRRVEHEISAEQTKSAM
jgi:hypothetical protein